MALPTIVFNNEVPWHQKPLFQWPVNPYNSQTEREAFVAWNRGEADGVAEQTWLVRATGMGACTRLFQ